jgi:hypothetical protein
MGDVICGKQDESRQSMKRIQMPTAGYGDCTFESTSPTFKQLFD